MKLKYLALISLLLCGINLGFNLGLSYLWCLLPLLLGVGYISILYLIASALCVFIVAKAIQGGYVDMGEEDTDGQKTNRGD